MPRLTADERQRALGLLASGFSQRDVAHHFDCHHTTILRLQHRMAETRSAADRDRPARERVTTPAQDRRIRAQHLRNCFQTAARTANESRVSSSIVRRRLHDIGLQAHRAYRGNILNERSRQRCLAWATQRRRWTEICEMGIHRSVSALGNFHL